MSASPRRGGAPHGALVINGHKGGTVNQHVRLRPVVLLLLAAVVAVFGLVWAMDAMGSESPAADTSAAAAADGGKVIYRVGWTREPDNLNPFVGYDVAGVRDLVPHLRLARRLRPQDALADEGRGVHRSRHRLDGERRRPRLDVHPPPERQVGRRRAAHRQGRRLHLQLHHPERDGEPHRVHAPHREGHGARRLHGRVHLLQAQAGHDPPLGADPAGARLVQGHAQARRRAASTPTTRRTWAPARSRAVEWKKTSHVKLVTNPTWWGTKTPAIDEIYFMSFTNNDTLLQDLIAGTIDGAVRPHGDADEAAQERADITARAITVDGFDDLGFNCYDGPEQGPPGAQGRQVPPGGQLGRRPREDRRPRWSGAAPPPGHDDHPAELLHRTPTGTGSRRPTIAYTFDPEKAKPAARRGRLHGRRRRRHPRVQGQEHRARPDRARGVDRRAR